MRNTITEMFRSITTLSTVALLIPSYAHAQDAAAPAQGSPTQAFMLQLPILLGFVALLYFAVIRPQRNQQKKHSEFVRKLAKGDEIVTTSGIIGRIVGDTERVITLEVSPGTELKVLRSAVQSYLKDSVGTPTPATK